MVVPGCMHHPLQTGKTGLMVSSLLQVDHFPNVFRDMKTEAYHLSKRGVVATASIMYHEEYIETFLDRGYIPLFPLV